MGYPLLAAVLFSLSIAMVTLCALLAGVFQPEASTSLPRSILGFLLTLILAAGLTVGGLASGLGSGSHWHSPIQRRPGPFESARALLHKLFDEDGGVRPKETATNIYLPPAGNVELTDNGFPGVVLLPEVKPEEAVVITPSLSWKRISPDSAPIQPFTIRFSGEYWMYRPPYDRPPRTSKVQLGNPLALSFRTTDHAPMSMEAYQKLERALDAKCCETIQIVISNTDRYPGTIALELVLIDTQSEGPPMLSLGSAAVTSRPRVNSWAGSALPASETLDFAIPFATPLRRFDAIKAIFHRERLRRENSARIAIERFLLLPRP
jgi:hypothetical protein